MKSICILSLTFSLFACLSAQAAKLTCDTGRGKFQLSINERALSFRGKTYYNTGARDLSRNQDQIYEAADGTTVSTTATLVYGYHGAIDLPNGILAPCRTPGIAAREKAARPAKATPYKGGGDYRTYPSYSACTVNPLNLLLGCYPVY